MGIQQSGKWRVRPLPSFISCPLSLALGSRTDGSCGALWESPQQRPPPQLSIWLSAIVGPLERPRSSFPTCESSARGLRDGRWGLGPPGGLAALRVARGFFLLGVDSCSKGGVIVQEAYFLSGLSPPALGRWAHEHVCVTSSVFV